MLILLLTGALLFWLSGILPLSYSFPYWILIVTACLVVNLGKEPTRLIQKLSLSLIGILFAFFFGDLILRVFASELFCTDPIHAHYNTPPNGKELTDSALITK